MIFWSFDFFNLYLGTGKKSAPLLPKTGCAPECIHVQSQVGIFQTYTCIFPPFISCKGIIFCKGQEVKLWSSTSLADPTRIGQITKKASKHFPQTLTTPFSTMSVSVSPDGYTTPGQSMRNMRRIKVMYCHTCWKQSSTHLTFPWLEPGMNVAPFDKNK